jgi:hypothetical protein
MEQTSTITGQGAGISYWFSIGREPGKYLERYSGLVRAGDQ